MKALQQLAGLGVEGADQLEERGQPDLAHAPLDPRDLHGRQTGALRKLLLRPALFCSGRSHVASELLHRVHPEIVRGHNQYVQNQGGISPRLPQGSRLRLGLQELAGYRVRLGAKPPKAGKTGGGASGFVWFVAGALPALSGGDAQ